MAWNGNHLSKLSSAGYSVLENLISIALISATFLLSIGSYVQAQKAVQLQNESNTRVRAIQSLISIMGMPSSLRAAAYNEGRTSALGECVFGTTGSCPASSITSWQPLSLLLPPRNAAGATVELSGPISGGPAHPILYSLEGLACNPATDSACTPHDFPIAVSTEGQTVCPPKCDVTFYYAGGTWVASDGTNHVNPEGLQISNWCPRAQYIRVRYTFKLAPGASDQFNFQTVSGTIMVSAPAANFTY